MAPNSADCLHNQIQAGDKYLSKVVPKILNSTHFLAGEAALFITFDEPNSHPDRSPGCSKPRYVPASSDECPILGLWIGPTVKTGFISDTFYSHYSYLKTVESAWQLPPLTINDTNASPMAEFFKSTFPTPQASFTISPTNPLVNQTVKFTSSMMDGTPPLTSIWDFGDGTPTASGSSITHAYGRNGTFTPKVTVTDSLQYKDTSSQSLPVTFPVSASFDYSPVDLVAGIRTSFIAHITGGWGEYSYSWDFGDGRTDTSSSPIHKYGDSGSYKVKLTVSDTLQHSASYNKTLIVNPMTGSIITDVAIPVAGDKITFTGIINGGTGLYVVIWNFGDGNQATGNLTMHTYTSDGVYRVRLNITDSTNLVARSTRDITVSKALCAVPKACNFTSDTSTPTTGQQILFKATASGGVGPYVFTWNFGDGETANGDSIQHTYVSTGTYNVTITVRDSAGHAYQTSNTLTIARSKTSGSPLSLFAPFVLVALASGVAFSGAVYWYRSRILGRLHD
jgi:PKD repeat protein